MPTHGVSPASKPLRIAYRGLILSWAAHSVMDVTLKSMENQDSKPINDIPGGTRKRIWVRIIFTKIFNNKVLAGGMTADINS